MEKKTARILTPTTFIAEASTGNPNLGWLDFVLTDDKPNNKNQGLKADTFERLIATGLLMPLKVARGGIALDHTGAEPLGAIAFLDTRDNTIIGKAALWKDERQADYEMLRTMAAEGENIDISWELLYTESELDDTGIEWITDPILTAATIVGCPAYGGRTPVLTVASDDPPEDDPPPKVDPLYNKEKFDELQGKVVELEKETSELRIYKETRIKQDNEEETLATRIAGLKKAGINVTEELAEKNKKLWLELSDDGFAAMVTVMGSVKEQSGAPEIPDVSGGSGNGDSIVDIVREGFRKMRTS